MLFFEEIADRLLNQNMDSKFGPDTINNRILNCNSMFLAPITEDEVLNVTSKLKGKFSAGYGHILETLVKYSIHFIKKTSAVTFIFNISLCSGTITNLMKIAQVLPIYKTGGKQYISNYRPISILPDFFFQKFFIRVVTFRNKHMISEAQNVSREKKSTNTATQTFIEDIQKALHNKLLVMGMFLDLTKAYDVIHHKLLLGAVRT
jgi:hypothetical protein